MKEIKNLTEKEYFLERYLRTNHYMTMFGKPKIAPSENMIGIKFDCSRKTARNVFQKLTKTNDLIPIKGKGYLYSYKGLRYLCNSVDPNRIDKIDYHKDTVIGIKRIINYFISEKPIQIKGNFAFKRTLQKEQQVIGIDYNICNTPIYIPKKYKKEDICMLLAQSGKIITRIEKQIFITNISNKKLTDSLDFKGESCPIILTKMYEQNELVLTQISFINKTEFNIEIIS